jgi:hypothetical protein
MLEPADLRAKTTPRPQLATVLDPDLVWICRTLADRFDEEGTAIEIKPSSLVARPRQG